MAKWQVLEMIEDVFYPSVDRCYEGFIEFCQERSLDVSNQSAMMFCEWRGDI